MYKKEALFFKTGNEKKELKYCHVAMDSFGTWLSNGFSVQKTFFWGDKKDPKKTLMKSKREMQKKKAKSKNACVFRESSSVGFTFFFCTFFSIQSFFCVSCRVIFSFLVQ